MTTILNVTRDDDGRFSLTDKGGNVIQGPYETNAEAWRELDRFDREAYDGLGKVKKRKPPTRRGKKAKAVKPARVAKKPGKLTPQQEHKMKVAAAKAPNWVRSAAMGKFDPAGTRAFRDQRLGTFGAASEVKRIDPAVYLAEKAARGEI